MSKVHVVLHVRPERMETITRKSLILLCFNGKVFDKIARTGVGKSCVKSPEKENHEAKRIKNTQ